MAAKHLRIAFYAPLKAPGHPVPSGDRMMAQMLLRCLGLAGHRAEVVSDLRASLGNPDDHEGWACLQRAARAERARIGFDWRFGGAPDLWFCYHPYYKSPDLIGPDLAAEFGLPYVTCEASYSNRRNVGIWAEMQAHSLAAVRGAAVNLCLTRRDAAGLLAATPDAPQAPLSPFIDPVPFAAPPSPEPGHLVTVAMMRAGDKLQSYRHLAAALALLPADLPWRLSVAGDGPERAQVQAMFAGLPADRLSWLGALDQSGVAALLARGAAFVWPGCGEAYGLAYLEAQAAGLPVAAFRTGGVPEVVAEGAVDSGDTAALAARLTQVLRHPSLAARQGLAARGRVLSQHSIEAATARLGAVIASVSGGTG